MSRFSCLLFILILKAIRGYSIEELSSEMEETLVEDPFVPPQKMMRQNSENLFKEIQSAIKDSKEDLQGQFEILVSRCDSSAQPAIDHTPKDYERRETSLMDSIKEVMERQMSSLQTLLQEAIKRQISSLSQDHASSCKSVQENIFSFFQHMKEDLVSCKKDPQVIEAKWKKIDSFISELQKNGEMMQLSEAYKNVKNIISSQNNLLKEMKTSLELTKYSIPFLPRTCSDHRRNGFKLSGLYTIFPTGKQQDSLEVECDMEDEGGGWITVLERAKQEDSMRHVNFNRTWEEYVAGFGDPLNEHWLGLKWLHLLTSSHNFEMKIIFKSIENGYFYAKYDIFRVYDFSTKYKLHVSGFQGNLGYDAIGKVHKDAPFSTWNNDNDAIDTQNCASNNGGGWWYVKCHKAVLTASHSTSNEKDQKTIRWYHQNDWLIITHAAMKIRERP